MHINECLLYGFLKFLFDSVDYARKGACDVLKLLHKFQRFTLGSQPSLH